MNLRNGVLLIGCVLHAGVGCGDSSPSGTDGGTRDATGPGTDARAPLDAPGTDAKVIPEDGGPPPGSLGSACDRAAPVCDPGLRCLYDLAAGYTCEPESTACDQPASPTGLAVGFIYGNWTLPAGTYDDITLDMHPNFSGPDDGSLQYFAFAGSFTGAPPGAGFYGGLQTKITNRTAASGMRGVIFSAFGITDAVAAPGAYVDIDLVACDGGVGAVCAQLSIPYAWHDGGTYRFRYLLAGDAPGRPGNKLLRTSVADVTTGVETVLGDLIIPSAWGMPAAYGTFDETYPPPPPEAETCQNYNASDIEFTRLRGNGMTGTVVHADGTYTGPCVNNFHYLPITDGYRMLLGICY